MHHQNNCVGALIMRPRQIDITKPLPVVWLETDEVSQQAQALEGLYKSLTVSKRSTEQVKQKNAELVQSQTRIPLKVCMGEVPIPACRIVDLGKEPDPPFERGPSYIHYAEAAYDFDVTEYELDDEDMDFVEEWNERCADGTQMAESDLEVMLNTFDNQAFLLRDKKAVGKLEDKLNVEAMPGVSSNGEEGSGLVVLTEEAMEKLQEFARAEGVDEGLLEYLSMPVEEEAACAICKQAQRVKRKDAGQEGDSTLGASEQEAGSSTAEENEMPSTVRTRQQPGRQYLSDSGDGLAGSLAYRNPERLLRCNKCNKYAHIRCYLPTWIPASDDDPWLCDYCDDVSSDLSASKSTRCELCHFDEGLLKRVYNSSHKRAHVTCGLFIPETSVGPQGIAGIEDVHPGRWGMVCKICREPGACVQCKARYCRAAYHPMCAHDEDLFMNCRSGTVYCPKHSAEKRARDEAGVRVNGTFTNSKRKKVDMELLVITPMVKEHSLEKLAHMPAPALEAAFGYWFRKRQRKGSAIVPRLALMQQEATEREATKRRRGKKVRLEDQEWVDRLVLLRQDLERGRILMDMVRRREMAKREWTAASKEIFELYIAHEEQYWGADSPKKRSRGRPRKDESPLLEPRPDPSFAEGMHHLWEFEPKPLPIEEVEILFPPGRLARPKKAPSTTVCGNGRVRVLERDPDGRFRGSGSSKKSHKKKTPRRPPTGRPVGRPRKYPLPEPIPPPVVSEMETKAVDAAPVVPLRVVSEDVEVDVTNVDSDAENSDVDIDGGIDDDTALPPINGNQLFDRSPQLTHGMHLSNGEVTQSMHSGPGEEEGGDEDYLGKRKSSRLNGVPLPALKKRRG